MRQKAKQGVLQAIIAPVVTSSGDAPCAAHGDGRIFYCGRRPSGGRCCTEVASYPSADGRLAWGDLCVRIEAAPSLATGR